MKKIFTLLIVLFTLSIFFAETNNIFTSKESLSSDEINAILLMREEEKLARDVYDYFANLYNSKIFYNISNSEQKHTDSVKNIIEKYNLEDPFINSTGVFENEELQNIYNDLIEKGSNSYIDALKIGAMIEELDIKDIRDSLNYIDNEDIIFVFNNLEKGSVNHLNSFMKNIEKLNSQYSPIYLSEDEFYKLIK
ncbi:hypothetical protein C7380_10382 [Oceanotoga teriensis]|jgi:hypothetical protein|uniref:DUF2202 domain-containing protein n=1 Tax=Oceanotoga teriensis TaxID=515440 RepID=A0AA45C8A3_9BACT|nr:DUF2202 domain-containing protein [Oceanotoga teriensis]PWJ95904.1 hypothetical protein C7380_10382 [Oceanotoga teriensis]